MNPKKLSALFFLLACLFACNSTNQDTQKAPRDQFFWEAKLLFAQHEFSKALLKIDSALYLDSARAEFHELRAKTLLSLGDTLASTVEFDLLLDSEIESFQERHIKDLVDWEISHHNKDGAIHLIERDLNLYEGDSVRRNRIVGYAFSKYLLLGDTVKARVLIKKRSNEEPANGEYWKMLGDLDFTQNRKRDALRAYEKYVSLEGSEVEVLFRMGNLALDFRRRSQARGYFKDAAERGHKGACENYRELTARTKYYTRSRCCDGTSSSSTGRGTCSHHGGVCRVEHVPYKEYTVDCP